MTKSELKTKLALYTGAKNSIAFRVVADIANDTNNSNMVRENTIRPCFYRSAGRHSGNMDYTGQICLLLDQLKVKYNITNDAARGGKVGTLITFEI